MPMIGTESEPIDGPAALAAVADEVRVCTRCALSARRTHAVPGEGNLRSDVLLVGEGPAPGRMPRAARSSGRPVSCSTSCSRSIGWERDDVFITNVVKCRPPGNRDPEPEEAAACAGYLERQERALDPAVVVTLGRHSLQSLPARARGSARHTGACAAHTPVSTSSRCTILLRRCTRPRCATPSSGTCAGCPERCSTRAEALEAERAATVQVEEATVTAVIPDPAPRRCRHR